MKITCRIETSFCLQSILIIYFYFVITYCNFTVLERHQCRYLSQLIRLRKNILNERKARLCKLRTWFQEKFEETLGMNSKLGLMQLNVSVVQRQLLACLAKIFTINRSNFNTPIYTIRGIPLPNSKFEGLLGIYPSILFTSHFSTT